MASAPASMVPGTHSPYAVPFALKADEAVGCHRDDRHWPYRDLDLVAGRSTSVANREAAQELEAMGFPILWINETTGRDPFVLATMLLAATSTLKLATGIANVYARDALTMSACQKTLAEAFPGRFLLGLGVSSPVLVERVRKHSYDKPLTYLSSYLDDMDAAPFNAVPPPKTRDGSSLPWDRKCSSCRRPGPTGPTRTSPPLITRAGRERSLAPTRCSLPNRW